MGTMPHGTKRNIAAVCYGSVRVGIIWVKTLCQCLAGSVGHVSLREERHEDGIDCGRLMYTRERSVWGMKVLRASGVRRRAYEGPATKRVMIKGRKETPRRLGDEDSGDEVERKLQRLEVGEEPKPSSCLGAIP
jgi:hypothetical protein